MSLRDFPSQNRGLTLWQPGHFESSYGMRTRDQSFAVSASSAESRLIVDSRSPGAIFDTKADAPASKNAWLAVGSFMAVNTITFVVGFTRVISRHASSEWTFGRFTSSTI